MKRPDGAYMTMSEMAETIQRLETSNTALRIQLDEKDEEIRRLKGEDIILSAGRRAGWDLDEVDELDDFAAGLPL